MNLDMTYAEFAYLRELVKKDQMRIWREEWAPYLGKNADFPKAFELVMEDQGACEEPFCNFLTDTGCCAKLLYRFEKAEKEVQTALGMRR